MHNCALRQVALMALLGALIFPGAASADKLVMKNGDVITGNISKIEDNEVFIEPDYADEFSVDLAEVMTLEADQTFEIEMEDGSKVDDLQGVEIPVRLKGPMEDPDVKVDLSKALAKLAEKEAKKAIIKELGLDEDGDSSETVDKVGKSLRKLFGK